jgi:hypothetical protein
MKRIFLLAIMISLSCVRDHQASTLQKLYYSRPASAVKSVVSGIAGCYTLWYCIKNTGNLCTEAVSNDRLKNKSLKCIEFSAIAGSCGYSTYALACYCWKHAKHALAIE